MDYALVMLPGPSSAVLDGKPCFFLIFKTLWGHGARRPGSPNDSLIVAELGGTGTESWEAGYNS